MNTFHTLSQQVDNTLKKEFNRFNEDIIFTTLVPSPSFRKKLLSFQTNVHNECEWINFFQENSNTLWLLHKKKILGAIYIVYHGIKTINRIDYPIFYISNRCTFDKSGHPYFTSGRLLWIYALRHIYRLSYGQRFIVWNHSTSSAKLYHSKMNMKSYDKLFPRITKKDFMTLTDVIEEKNNVREEYLDDGLYLFYRALPMDYNDLYDSFQRNIQVSQQDFSSQSNNQTRKKRK
jgi:hypothetical protein